MAAQEGDWEWYRPKELGSDIEQQEQALYSVDEPLLNASDGMNRMAEEARTWTERTRLAGLDHGNVCPDLTDAWARAYQMLESAAQVAASTLATSGQEFNKLRQLAQTVDGLPTKPHSLDDPPDYAHR